MGFSEEVAMNNKKHWIKLAASGLLSASTWGLSAPQGSAYPFIKELAVRMSAASEKVPTAVFALPAIAEP